MEGPPTLAPQTAAPEKLAGIDAPDLELVTALVTGQVIREADVDLIPTAFDERGGGFICDVLLERGLVSEVNLLRFFATHLRTRFVTAEKLAAAAIDSSCLERLPVRQAEELAAIPLWWDAGQETLSCIVAVPLTGERLARLRQVANVRQLNVFLATWSAVAAAQQKHYYRNTQAFDDFAPSGAGPGPERAPQEPSPTEVSEKTRVLFHSEHENLVVLRQENVRFRIAQEFHRRVQVLRGLGPQLDAIVELVFDLLTADTVVIELADGTMAFRSHFENPDVAVPRSLVAEALDHPEGLLRNGIGMDGGSTSESVMVKGIKSAMVVPLVSAQGSLGTLYLESLSAPAAFDENDLKMVAGVAAQAAAVIQNSTLLAQVEREAEARTHLSRFLPPQLVDQAVAGGIDLQLESRSTNATILYADIRGFTRATDTLGAAAIVRALTGFYDQMSEAVFDTQGMVDKFMGDCIMAVWGAPLPVPEHAQLALLAAQEMVRRASRLELGDKPLELGIGISSGEVVVGAIGGSRRMDYTVIGPAVNVAARLCDLARGGQILASRQTILAGGKGLNTERLPPTPLKGVADDIEIHRVLWTLAPAERGAAPTDLAQTPVLPPVPRMDGTGTDPYLPVATSVGRAVTPVPRTLTPVAFPAVSTTPAPPPSTPGETLRAYPAPLLATAQPPAAPADSPDPDLAPPAAPEPPAIPPAPTPVAAAAPAPPSTPTSAAETSPGVPAPLPPPSVDALPVTHPGVPSPLPPPAAAPAPVATPTEARTQLAIPAAPSALPPAAPAPQPAPPSAPSAEVDDIEVDLDLAEPEEEPLSERTGKLVAESPPLPAKVPWIDPE